MLHRTFQYYSYSLPYIYSSFVVPRARRRSARGLTRELTRDLTRLALSRRRFVAGWLLWLLATSPALLEAVYTHLHYQVDQLEYREDGEAEPETEHSANVSCQGRHLKPWAAVLASAGKMSLYGSLCEAGALSVWGRISLFKLRALCLRRKTT